MKKTQGMSNCATFGGIEQVWSVYQEEARFFTKFWMERCLQAQEEAQKLLTAWLASVEEASTVFMDVMRGNLKEASRLATEEWEHMARLLGAEAVEQRADRLAAGAARREARISALEE